MVFSNILKYYTVNMNSGFTYYFLSKENLIDYFLSDGKNLVFALDNQKELNVNKDELTSLLKDTSNLIEGKNLIVNKNLKRLTLFNRLDQNIKFKLLIKDFVSNTNLTEESISASVLFMLKKKILKSSSAIPFLFNAFKINDSILEYFLIVESRESNTRENK
jgi:hypothetical protein